MSYLVPKSFWSLPSLMEMEDENWGFASNIPNGLSLSEDEKNVYAEAAVPGVDPKNVDVTYEKGIVKITAASSQVEKQGHKIWKRGLSEFSYQFSIPTDVDANKDPEAEIKNGVLHLTFAKSPQATPRKISIKGK